MKAGNIFILTSGEYSDFGIVATLRALRDFDFHAEFSRAVSGVDEDDYVDYVNAVGRFIDAGVVEHVDIPEIYLGAYGRYEPSGESDCDGIKSWVEQQP